MSVRDQLNNAIYNGLRKNHQKLMSSVAINTGAVADRLLAQGWRPPVRVIETVEELEAVKFPAILYGSGTCVEGKDRFEDCQFRPVPELVGGEPGLFETLVVLGVGAPFYAWAKDIRLPVKVLWEPEGEA